MAGTPGTLGSPDGQYYLDPDSPVLPLGYSIRDPENGTIFFSRGCGNDTGDVSPIPGIPPENGICYMLPVSFLEAHQVACQLVFRNTSTLPVSGLRVMEEHYLQGELLQRFEFRLPFVPPGTKNTWEHMYSPEFRVTRDFVRKAVEGPWTIHTWMWVSTKGDAGAAMKAMKAMAPRTASKPSPEGDVQEQQESSRRAQEAAQSALREGEAQSDAPNDTRSDAPSDTPATILDHVPTERLILHNQAQLLFH